MSPYLLAFVISKFSSQTASSKPYPVGVYYRPDLEDYTSTAIKYGGGIIEALGQYFGIDYSGLGNSKMDFVGLPEFNGGMENWGLVTYG